MRDYKPGEQLVVSNMLSDFIDMFNGVNLITHDNIPALSTGQFVYDWVVTAAGGWYTSPHTTYSEPLSSTSEQYFASIVMHDPDNTVETTYVDKIRIEILKLQTRSGQI